jgi:hypothetical protein
MFLNVTIKDIQEVDDRAHKFEHLLAGSAPNWVVGVNVGFGSVPWHSLRGIGVESRDAAEASELAMVFG